MTAQGRARDAELVQTHRFLANKQESNSPWRQPSITLLPTEGSITLLPTEESIAENLMKHEHLIIANLEPEQPTLVQLLTDLELEDAHLHSESMKREQKARQVLDKIIERSAYSAFLASLEEDTEHMGHRYIVSLLRGEQFAREEILHESKVLSERISKNMVAMTKGINMDELEQYLVAAGLLTTEEQHQLNNSQNTPTKKSRLFLSWLKTKGPTAHYLFVHECLAAETSHRSHGELYNQLTTSRMLVKRQADDSVTETLPPTKVTKCYPAFLEPPKGITTRCYFEKMWDIRQFYQSGRNYWDNAEDMYRKVITSPKNPLEMKIAFVLESTYSFILDKQSAEVFARVSQAREMCNELYQHSCNAQVLEGRCEWILAKHYRYTGEHDKALAHIGTAFSLVANCEPGEEKALVNYCHGCTLVDMGLKTPRDKAMAINALTTAVGCANKEEHGVRIECILRHGKIRLAQVYLSPSSESVGENSNEVPRDSVEDAKRVLRDVDEQELESHPRTKCMYLYTWSDVYKSDGQLDRARESAELALEIAQECHLKDEARLVQSKYKLLQNHRQRIYSEGKN